MAPGGIEAACKSPGFYARG